MIERQEKELFENVGEGVCDYVWFEGGHRWVSPHVLSFHDVARPSNMIGLHVTLGQPRRHVPHHLPRMSCHNVRG